MQTLESFCEFSPPEIIDIVQYQWKLFENPVMVQNFLTTV